jgi:hypothetical protein
MQLAETIRHATYQKHRKQWGEFSQGILVSGIMPLKSLPKGSGGASLALQTGQGILSLNLGRLPNRELSHAWLVFFAGCRSVRS